MSRPPGSSLLLELIALFSDASNARNRLINLPRKPHAMERTGGCAALRSGS